MQIKICKFWHCDMHNLFVFCKFVVGIRHLSIKIIYTSRTGEMIVLYNPIISNNPDQKPDCMPCFLSIYPRYPQKIILKSCCIFGQCVITETLYNPGVFYIFKKSVLAARRGMCSTLTYHSNFKLPTTSLNHPILHPKYPKIIRKLLRRTFEKSFIFNHFQLPKNPPIPSNHPKIPLQNHKTPNKINSFSNKVQ